VATEHNGEIQSSVSPAGNHEQVNARNPERLFVNFYRVSREEYSPAEGGCWFDYYQPFLCLPVSRLREMVFPTRWTGDVWSFADDDLTEEARLLVNLYAEDNLGLTLESTIVCGRTARPIYSACWQGRADARWHLEGEPFESMTRVWPHYE
jgi:hypothetical protein